MTKLESCINDDQEFRAYLNESTVIDIRADILALVKKSKKVAPKTTRTDAAIYFHELGSLTCNDDADDFCNHFESNGWKVSGKTPMKDWRASVRKWHKNKQKGMFAAPERGGMLGAGVTVELFNDSPPVSSDMEFLAATRARTLEHQG